MLTQVEKDILGFMVDIGALRGEDRISVASDDSVAKERIDEFIKAEPMMKLQLDSLNASKTNLEAEISAISRILDLINTYKGN